MTQTPKWTALPVMVDGGVVAFSIVDDDGVAVLIGPRQGTAAQTKAVMDMASAALELGEAAEIAVNGAEDCEDAELIVTIPRACIVALAAALAKARGETK